MPKENVNVKQWLPRQRSGQGWGAFFLPRDLWICVTTVEAVQNYPLKNWSAPFGQTFNLTHPNALAGPSDRMLPTPVLRERFQRRMNHFRKVP